MTPATARLLRNVTLGLAALVIAANILGMLDVITKVARPRDLNIIAFALILTALAFRRRSEGPRT